MDIISAIASLNALLIAFLISVRKKKSLSDYILIAWIINFALHFFVPFGIERQLFFHESLWGFFMGISIVAHGPFIFVYTSSLTSSDFKVSFKNFYHFGFILVFAATFIPYLSLPQEVRIQLVEQKSDLSFYMLFPMLSLLVIRIYFLVRTIIMLIKHQHNIRQVYSYEAKINLRWIKLIVYGFFMVIAMSFVLYTFVSAQLLSVFWMDYILILLNIVLFYYIAYSGYRQNVITRIVSILPISNNGQSGIFEINQKLNGNKRPKTLLNHPVIQKLNTLLEDEKLYLEPELHIEDVAIKLNIQTHQLSKLINHQLKKNFFEYINEYRVEEFKKMVADPKNKNISILGLAMDSGFNSKATFYRFFKRSTGITPSEFKESFDYKSSS